MAGPNLELFKFGLYLFFPLAVMLHYGDVEFYNRNVLPVSFGCPSSHLVWGHFVDAFHTFWLYRFETSSGPKQRTFTVLHEILKA